MTENNNIIEELKKVNENIKDLMKFQKEKQIKQTEEINKNLLSIKTFIIANVQLQKTMILEQKQTNNYLREFKEKEEEKSQL